MSDSLRHHGLYSPWKSPGQNTGVGSLSLLQGIFPRRDRTQVSIMQVESLPAEPQGTPRFPEKRMANGYLLQYSCLENFMDRGVWRVAKSSRGVHGVTKSQTQLSD